MMMNSMGFTMTNIYLEYDTDMSVPHFVINIFPSDEGYTVARYYVPPFLIEETELSKEDFEKIYDLLLNINFAEMIENYEGLDCQFDGSNLTIKFGDFKNFIELKTGEIFIDPETEVTGLYKILLDILKILKINHEDYYIENFLISSLIKSDKIYY